ncbi:hypothetical protein BD324DRAFT_657779 [Kockovaella imperatae]|uniref:DH domain-containing protein n=1 Tax=Kockovaella imperatae TaxID=4999 RepID=A0A1Y1U8S1_9TREE|nr:hypothetical protein BD324DRAFT_657779 [Kockovaella imperatae]ORX34423.1 hypothetical protein BD324DRAFT_657779 [Kockovaella imperatae]
MPSMSSPPPPPPPPPPMASTRALSSRSPEMTRSTPPIPFALPSSYRVQSPRQRPLALASLAPSPISRPRTSAPILNRSPSVTSTSSSSSGSTYSQQVYTPPLTSSVARSKKDRLLPAIPLNIDKQQSQSPDNSHIDFHAVAKELVGSIAVASLPSPISPCNRLSSRRQVNQHLPLSPLPSPTPRRESRQSPLEAVFDPSTPPPTRPRRRRASVTESTFRAETATPVPVDFLVPRPPYARAASPASTSTTNSTITEVSTPKVRRIPDQPAPLPPPPASCGPTFPDRSTTEDRDRDITITPIAKKRDSTQRRLSALRGLVANLDFNQHWSFAGQSEEATPNDQVETIFWACGGDPPFELNHSGSECDSEIEESPNQRLKMSPPLTSPVHMGTPPPPPPSFSPHDGMNITTPSRPLPRRLPSSTPPRRPRLFRSSSDLHAKTPDPPRPASRQRREFTGVASSGYSKSLERSSSPEELATPLSTWRSCLSSDRIHDQLLAQNGTMEIKRQEIMWEMCETEKAFVKSMKTVLRLFATPLKTPQGKWIDGISDKISELFDLLECVVQAHSIIASQQRDLRRANQVLDVRTFVGIFKSWVDRLTVHEWYLVRFEAVVQTVEDNVRDSDSVFGEFVRMQMKEEVLGSMSLGSMLLKPVQRLTKYPLFLKRLLDVTPHSHPCQSDILSLLSRTEHIILHLQAAKARKDDLDHLEVLESKLAGLPVGFRLAVPGRKLLGHGQVVRRTQGSSPSPVSRSRAGSIHSSRGSISSTISSSISPWDFIAHGGPAGGGTRISNFSTTSSLSSYNPPSRSNSLVRDVPMTSPRGPLTTQHGPTVTRSPSTASASSASCSVTDWRPSTPSSMKSPSSLPSSTSSLSGSSRKRSAEDQVVMLIFDDLVLVGHTIHERGLFSHAKKKKDDKVLKLLGEAEGGIGKVVDVRDWTGWQGHASLFTLSLSAPCDPENPMTFAYSIPSNPTPLSKLKTDRQGTTNNAGNLFGPPITSLGGIITTLCQATHSDPTGTLTSSTSGNALDHGTDEEDIDSMGVLTEYLAE